MSNTRPNFIDLRSNSQASLSRPLRSPRLHVAGEAPPELSPLDAFAMQSRLLAKKLEEESNKAGRRMSRLPPLTTESPLIVQGRSDYFRSMSQDSGSDCGDPPALHNTGLGLRTEVEDSPVSRPVSMHPRMSRIPPTPDESIPLPQRPSGEALRGRRMRDVDQGETFFGARRELSPVPLGRTTSAESDTGSGPLSRSATQDSQLSQPSPRHGHSLGSSPDKALNKQSFDSAGLFPPRSLFPKRSSSIMSAPLESTGEEGVNSMSTSFYSQQAGKLSSSPGMMSPGLGHFQRSPSISSEASGFPRPSFNFSRPLTRSGTPGLESPARQASSDSQASFVFADDSANTPVSMSSEGFPDTLPEDGRAAAPSYIYSKFSLPRGKSLQRLSPSFPENHVAAYHWEQPPIVPPSNVQTFPIGGQPPPSPPTRPSSSAGPRFFEEPIPRPSLERSKLSIEVVRSGQQPSPDLSRPSTEGGRASEDVPRGRPLTSPLHDAARGKTPMSTSTSDSASTIKATRSQFSQAASSVSEMTGEEHVAKAIALHESGSLNESTYHLRHAAKKGHPTGMLLYALACRHGWGMRPNQREGVEWLRKAAESASVEIADDEGQVKEGKTVDFVERKTRKAQFALSIYELGVSHMNGWGIEQDKALALRCFEIAGCKNTPSFGAFSVGFR